MSVTESCHNIESELNLHDLAMETREREEVPFDPEEEILEGDWEKVQEIIDSRIPITTISDLHSIAEAKILFPDHIVCSKGFTEEKFRVDLQQRLEQNRRDGQWWEFAMTARAIKVAYPEMLPEEAITDEDLGGLRCEIRNWLNDIDEHNEKHMWEICQLFAVIKLIAPVRFRKLKVESDAIWNDTLELELYRRGDGNMPPDMINFASQAAAMKIVNPERAGELKLDKKIWGAMTEDLHRFRREDFWDFIKLLSSMKILAAEKVSVDSNGLHLVMPSREKFKEEMPELPVRREF